jgi:Tfp pilus assembly protein PilN
MRPVNLIPEAQRRRQPRGDGKLSQVSLAVLAALFLMVVTYVFVANQATSRENDAAAAAAEADRLEAEALRMGAFGDFAQVKATRTASVRQLATARFDWERLVRELARVLPSGSWLQSVDASVTGETSGSTGTDTGAGGPTAQLTGCAPRQPDTAALLLRLRRMHRVEDVVLNESTREVTGGEPTLDSCGRFYQFDVTVSFAPTVTVEPPVGERRVPASLGGGS